MNALKIARQNANERKGLNTVLNQEKRIPNAIRKIYNSRPAVSISHCIQ